MEALKFISLGWGVQSWALAAMVALGELPPVEAAIHSDTTWERQATYEFAAQMTPWLTERGVQVVTVGDKEAARQVLDGKMIPAYFDSKDARARRTCTQRWKIAPMRRYIQSIRNNKPVELWLGITTDEFHRAKDSNVKYIAHRYPLLDKRMSRGDCIYWLGKHGLPVPKKSACTFCPLHNRRVWEEMKREGGADWDQAVSIDQTIRVKRNGHLLFLHSACVPLPEAVTIPEDFGASQLAFDIPDDECDSGFCFL